MALEHYVVTDNDGRQRLRLHSAASVEIETVDNRRVVGQLRDIGLDSLYMLSDEDNDDFLILGEPVHIKLIMQRRKSTMTIDLDANIVRIDEGGFAAKFNESLTWWPIFTMFPLIEYD